MKAHEGLVLHPRMSCQPSPRSGPAGSGHQILRAQVPVAAAVGQFSLLQNYNYQIVKENRGEFTKELGNKIYRHSGQEIVGCHFCSEVVCMCVHWNMCVYLCVRVCV